MLTTSLCLIQGVLYELLIGFMFEYRKLQSLEPCPFIGYVQYGVDSACETGLVSLYCGDTESTFHSRREGWLERTRRFWYLIGCHGLPKAELALAIRELMSSALPSDLRMLPR